MNKTPTTLNLALTQIQRLSAKPVRTAGRKRDPERLAENPAFPDLMTARLSLDTLCVGINQSVDFGIVVGTLSGVFTKTGSRAGFCCYEPLRKANDAYVEKIAKLGEDIDNWMVDVLEGDSGVAADELRFILRDARKLMRIGRRVHDLCEMLSAEDLK